MQTLVIYDSLFGNTEKIAKEIARVLKARIKDLTNINLKEIRNIDLLVIGTPTHNSQASPRMINFLSEIPSKYLQGIRVAVFDTRIGIGLRKGILGALIRHIDFASPKIARSLERKGAKLIASTEGFLVTGKKGPLVKGEILRAKKWAILIKQKALKLVK